LLSCLLSCLLLLPIAALSGGGLTPG
jgi:hypothetical protein